MELRPYQITTVNNVLSAQSRLVNRVLYVLATGLGKTTIFCHIVNALVKMTGRPALIIAHRDELLDQAAKRLAGDCPDLRVEIEAGPRRAGHRAQVVVSSVQTLGRAACTRLDWLAKVKPCVIVIDECHRSQAASYRAVMDRFDTFVVGCTATPTRFDKKPLVGAHGIFDEQVMDYGILDGIKDGYLCRLRNYLVETTTDLSGIKNVAGDFNQGDLAKAVDVVGRTMRTIDYWFDYASDGTGEFADDFRKTLVFCVDVDHAHHAAECWRSRGIKAECIWGAMPKDDRRSVLDRYKHGDVQVVTNVECLTEGFDAPETSCIVMLRPTQSWGLYAQMVGRGTRLKPDGGDCVIIDVADNCQRHNLMNLPEMFGVKERADGEDIVEVIERKERERIEKEQAILDMPVATNIRPVDLFDEVLDLLNGQTIPSYGVSEKQRKLLRSLKFTDAEINRMTPRQASGTIGSIMALKSGGIEWRQLRAEYERRKMTEIGLY